MKETQMFSPQAPNLVENSGNTKYRVGVIDCIWKNLSRPKTKKNQNSTLLPLCEGNPARKMWVAIYEFRPGFIIYQTEPVWSINQGSTRKRAEFIILPSQLGIL